jgi:hypothetical protein
MEPEASSTKTTFLGSAAAQEGVWIKKPQLMARQKNITAMVREALKTLFFFITHLKGKTKSKPAPYLFNFQSNRPSPKLLKKIKQ